MKKRAFILFVAYIWTKTLVGLTFYPFTSLRQIVRRPVLFPVLFSPFIGLFCLFVAGRVGALFVTLHGVDRNIIALFLSTVLISIFLWQTLLFYLLGSFLLAFWRKK